MSRYGNIEFVLKMGYQDGISLITEATKKINENRAFQMWLMLYPDMTTESFIPFSEFHKSITQPEKKVIKRSTEAMLAEMEEIRKRFESPSPEA